MSMIKIENLTFSYPTSYDNVFENVSFQVDTDWKLGFVGRNGRGKTTFLNLLLGKYEYSGKILSSVQFDYFPYPVSDKNRITEDILQEICPLAEEPVSFEIRQGERIVLDGKNGSGKSSLLKLVVGQSIDYTGTVTLGSGLVISYVPQDTSYLCGTLSEFAEENNLDESLFKAILRKMDFERVQFEKDIKDFSGGQKKKVLIAKSLCEKAHLYVWDEPLNFIDVYSRMQIEQLITEFAPTMLLVEHDSVFRDTVASKIVNI